MNYGCTFLAACALALGLATPVSAGPLDDAYAAYQQGDYACALRLFRPLAEQGNARAQTLLGLMYEDGQGVPKNFAQAAKWYQRASEQDFAMAQNNLGLMYLNGEGVRPRASGEMVLPRRRARFGGSAD
jgi:TPR repeat protein